MVKNETPQHNVHGRHPRFALHLLVAMLLPGYPLATMAQPLDGAEENPRTITWPRCDEGTGETPCQAPQGPALPDPRDHPFPEWLDLFMARAIAAGIPADVAKKAKGQIRYDAQTIQLERKQPEYSQTFFGYLGSRADEGTVALGKRRLAENQSWLNGVSTEYGVPAEILIALWGLESGFGRFIGDKDILSGLATLAYDGRRSDFYSEQLLAALRMISEGHIPMAAMKGSWAGAMGQVQFMPTTFLDHASDGDGDGRVDIWDSKRDALVSAANYLSRIGWRAGQPWGIEVSLPEGFDPYYTDASTQLTRDEWIDLGVTTATGGPLPAVDSKGAILLPSGIQGPAFLVYDNFHRITEWNNSLLYALSVGYLAQRISGGPKLSAGAPASEQKFHRAQIVALQNHLNRLGFDCGEADGMIGAKTRQAIRDYQRDQAMLADGFPTLALYDRLAGRAEETTTLAAPEEAPPARADKGTEMDKLLYADIRILQKHLNRLGFACGEPDGVMGANTRRALKAYQQSKGMIADGNPTLALVAQLKSDAVALPPDDAEEPPSPQAAQTTPQPEPATAKPKPTESDPETAVRGFYQALKAGQCEQALTLRPGYTLARCQQTTGVKDIQTETAHAPAGQRFAVIKLSVEIEKKGQWKPWSGFVTAKRDKDDVWVVAEGSYRSGMALETYTKDPAIVKLWPAKSDSTDR